MKLEKVLVTTCRYCLTPLMIYKAWCETGFWTAACLILIFAACEIHRRTIAGIIKTLGEFSEALELSVKNVGRVLDVLTKGEKK